jgi:hypothetical protein
VPGINVIGYAAYVSYPSPENRWEILYQSPLNFYTREECESVAEERLEYYSNKGHENLHGWCGVFITTPGRMYPRQVCRMYVEILKEKEVMAPISERVTRFPEEKPGEEPGMPSVPGWEAMPVKRLPTPRIRHRRKGPVAFRLLKYKEENHVTQSFFNISGVVHCSACIWIRSYMGW